MSDKRILVFADSSSVRRACESIFAPRGFDLDLASDGQEALALAVERQPELVLLDEVPPGIRGPDICAALASHSRTTDIPVAFVSPGDAAPRGSHLAASNVVRFVAGPFKPAAILAVARNRPDVPVVDRDFGAVPWLVKLIDPALLVFPPTRSPEIREALARIPESRARRILLAGAKGHPSRDWEDFERIDPREAPAAGIPDPTMVTDQRITLEVVPR